MVLEAAHLGGLFYTLEVLLKETTLMILRHGIKCFAFSFAGI